MASTEHHQIILKPQDFLLALKIALNDRRSFTYASVSAELFLSASEAHASARRAILARLVTRSSSSILEANRVAILEFAVHGVKFAFPAVQGPFTRGVATASAGPSLRKRLVQTEEAPPVWPYPAGSARGPALYPLYPSVPLAVEKDEGLYDVLTLVDAIRIGAARERELSIEILQSRLS